jgi:hypothetical protein
VLGLEDLQGLDKMPKNSPYCLLLALISCPLNDPRRQGIGIFFSSQMGCLHDNTLCTFILYIIDLIMEHVCVFQWESGALIYKTKLSNKCIGTRLLEPNVATPLYVVVAVL